MEVRITVRSEGAAPEGGLLEWLRREPELRGLVKVEPRPSSLGEEAMGVPLEIVIPLLSGPVAHAIARCVRTWIEHRKPVVELEVKTERGIFRYKQADGTAGTTDLERALIDVMRGPASPAPPDEEPTELDG